MNMETKKCSNCCKEKSINDFYIQLDRKNGASKCKDCHNEYCIIRWQKIKINALTYKGGYCLDCHIKYPDYPAAVFEFHHLNPKLKDVSWNKLRLRSWDKIKIELDKCVLLCANCHRIRHNE
jgi:hypothetical protein